ncbi:RING/U-box superfamily protein [Quillaja saponaria]|uniref:RING-type E3 ubiquitin transferase n=1 Tax=Quillaja saponaria TaxID=32244 RepID=A0AAD7VNN1_QUISA|nr:RING/U-box superfamily protein [Quillaja saponaria]
MDLNDPYCDVFLLYSDDEQNLFLSRKIDPGQFSLKFEVTEIYDFEQTHNFIVGRSFEVSKDHVFQENSSKDTISSLLSMMNVPLNLHGSVISWILACTRNKANEEYNKIIGMFVSIFITCFESDEDQEEAMDDENVGDSDEDNNVGDYDSNNLEEFLRDAMLMEMDQLYESWLVPASKETIEGLEKVRIEGSRGNCSICLEDFEDGFEAIRMPCSHIYHGDCIVNWLHKKNLCPLCRFAL